MEGPAPNFESVLTELGRCIRAARLQAGLTQRAACERAGIDQKRWQRIEAGAVNVSIHTLHRVASAVGTNIQRLCPPRWRQL